MTGFNKSDHDRLDRIDEEIAAARKAAHEKPESLIPVTDAGAMNAGRVGFAMMGIVLAGLGFGWLADAWLEISPWGIFAGLFSGFVLAVVHAWRVMREV